jgi:hypothetical protein
MAEIPHLAWPFRMAGRRLAQVEQDGLEDVTQSVRSYLATARGARPLSPDFGLEDPTFGPGVDPVRLAAEIMDAEDGRADVVITTVGVDAQGRQQVTVSVDVVE